MPLKTGTAEKILSRLKGLRNHMQAGEVPVFTVPAIWDAGQGQRSMPCDVVVTNQRIFGYVYVSFPRERLFLDALSLATIRVPSAGSALELADNLVQYLGKLAEVR